VGDPVATIERALAANPGFVMGQLLKAWLHLLGTEPSGAAVARSCLRALDGLRPTARERAHMKAVALLADGHWRAAGRVLEDVTIAYPTDALALQAGHQVDFFTGDARMLRDRIARALPAWSVGMPGYHAVLGMHAFGLEETGEFARAEAQGRRAVELEPRDGWAWHAVAHVLESQGRHAEGVRWLAADPEPWSKGSFFAVHNWWHLALYHLEAGDTDAVLGLFDGPIWGHPSRSVLDLVDASALLWRLQLRGLPVGGRWQAVAQAWEEVGGAGRYAFNDAHAMMAFVGAGREAAAARILEAQRAAMAGADDNAAFTREVGWAVTRAIKAFGDGDFAGCVRLLRPVRGIAHRFGGSHAQRDLLDLTLLEASIRAGQGYLARGLAAERIERKPASPLARLLAARTAALAPFATLAA
jgi:tetratricopeptide (TPR) repeat protein